MAETLGNLIFISKATMPGYMLPGVAIPNTDDLSPIVYQAPTYQVTVIPG